jgi:hypothetical protein
MPDGSCAALFPGDGRLPPAGRVAGWDGTLPALGRAAPDAGSCLGRETEPEEGRETFPVLGRLAGRETAPVDGRAEPPPDARELDARELDARELDARELARDEPPAEEREKLPPPPPPPPRPPPPPPRPPPRASAMGIVCITRARIATNVELNANFGRMALFSFHAADFDAADGGLRIAIERAVA